ncbi:MAG: FG-GAP repeat protein [Planctomycetes bacterium]|nr:FG-GAP repeat protein [Planctomycetota bacterium]
MMTRTWWQAVAVVATLVVSAQVGLGQASEIAKLLAGDGAADDRFGVSVSINGDTALVGAYQDDDRGLDSGGAYVFVRSGGRWSQQTKILAHDGTPGDLFGHSVAIDGDTALIGAYGDGLYSGSAYVYVRSGGSWLQQAKLVASDGAALDRFGISVCLDGDTAIIGADRNDAPGVDFGSAYVFVRSSGLWSQQAKLVAIDPSAYASFGRAVSLDGDQALIGADYDDERGSAYVFVRSGGVWSHQGKLVASDGSMDDHFGYSVWIDGDAGIIGAHGDDDRGSTSGSAYVFVRSGGSWVQEAKLLLDDGYAHDRFGISVSLDQNRAIVGSNGDDDRGSESGSAHVFIRSEQGWIWQAKLMASDGAYLDQFGVNLSLDGDSVVIGAWRSAGHETSSGSAYMFEFSGTETAARSATVFSSGSYATSHVATANSATHDFSLWTNDGTGTLSESRIALDPFDRAPIVIAAGDLDDDGLVDDVAVACADSHSVGRVMDLGGTPLASTQPCGGLQPTCVTVGDLDADGRDEVFVGREGTPFSGGAGLAVSWNGAVFTELPIPGGHATRVQKLALLDLDGDGDNDLVALVHGSPDELLLFAGDGAGTLVFADAIPLATSGFASGLCAGDLDGDGDVDLAVALATLFPLPATELRILSHDGSSALQASAYSLSPPIATGGVLATDLACGELEDDSIPGFLSRRDLIVVHGGSGDARVFSGWDGASFQSTRLLTVGQNPIAAAVGDLDGDGGDDVVIVNQGSSDLSVNLTVQPALAQVYGAGCPGTDLLTPVLVGIGTPLSGGSGFSLELEQARSFAPTLLLYSLGLGDLALGAGCSLYVELPAGSLLLFTNGRGQASQVLSVPPDPLLLGGDAYFQAAVFDPAGAFAATLALSNGVRLQVGS